MKPTDLLELNDDLQRESERLARLVSSVELLLPRLGEGGELVEAAALRLHSFYTAVAALMASNCAARLVPTTCEVPRRF